jgi:hypothetical protein
MPWQRFHNVRKSPLRFSCTPPYLFEKEKCSFVTYLFANFCDIFLSALDSNFSNRSLSSTWLSFYKSVTYFYWEFFFLKNWQLCLLSFLWVLSLFFISITVAIAKSLHYARKFKHSWKDEHILVLETEIQIINYFRAKYNFIPSKANKILERKKKS